VKVDARLAAAEGGGQVHVEELLPYEADHLRWQRLEDEPRCTRLQARHRHLVGELNENINYVRGSVHWLTASIKFNGVHGIGMQIEHSPSSLISALTLGDRSAVAAWIAAGGDVNQPRFDHSTIISGHLEDRLLGGVTCLIAACALGDLQLVELLLSHRADAESTATEHSGTALMAACESGNVMIVDKLLGVGASLDAQDVDGMTALMHACVHGSRACVKALIAKRADPRVQCNVQSAWAIHYAQRAGHKKIVKMLSSLTPPNPAIMPLPKGSLTPRPPTSWPTIDPQTGLCFGT